MANNIMMYARVLGKLIDTGKMTAADSVLVICGGDYDKRTFLAAGISNVVISNVDHHGGVSDYAPYVWEFQDAESISREDSSFDWVAVHAGLHHCASPHRALCEMLRVARKGVLVVEANDSLLMRIGVRLKLIGSYEFEPVLLTNGASGGVRNTSVPNFVYRWTKREVRKTALSYEPHNELEFDFHYGWGIRTVDMSKSIVIRTAKIVANFGLRAFKHVLWRQGNEFAFAIRRTGKQHPWIRMVQGRPTGNIEHIAQFQDRDRYPNGTKNS